MSDSPPLGVRARARAQLLSDVSRIAREHLAESGASSLSVRAIAREMGLASSALYRYYPSRDALLTQLIIEAYTELGDATQAAEARIARTDLAGRFRAIAHTVRNWAVAHPHEFALIYGSPVPGYAAPDDTIDPATRVTSLLTRLIDELDGVEATDIDVPVPPQLATQLEGINAVMEADVDHAVLAVGVGLWAQLFGMVSFELFGTFNNVFNDASEIFDFQIERAVGSLFG